MDHATKNVAMEMQITAAEERVWTLQRHYFEALRAAGYGNLTISKPHISTKHIIKRLKLFQLHRIMLNIIQWRKMKTSSKKTLITSCGKELRKPKIYRKI